MPGAVRICRADSRLSPPVRVTIPHAHIEPLAGGTRVPRPPAAIAITAAPAGAFLTGLKAAVGPASAERPG